MSSDKPSCNGEPAKPDRFPRVAATVIVVALGAGISLHLHANHLSHWWLPLVLLIIAHGAIISGMVWIILRLSRRRPDAGGPAAKCCDKHHRHSEHSKVIHTPCFYDWLVRVLALGGEQKFRQQTLDLAKLQSGEAVLDVGCGTGTLLIEAAKRIGPDGSAHGIEASTEMVARARRKATAQSVTIKFIEGSADHLPFAEASFDVIFCTMVLHHLPATMQAAAIGEMSRMLRPAGRIVIVDLQRPKTVSTALSLVTLFHKFSSHATAPDWQKIELLLKQHGVQHINRHAMFYGAVNMTVGQRVQSDQPQ
jgi:ubiquinone/menaquinone biosynthesis C-methylase UbiE